MLHRGLFIRVAGILFIGCNHDELMFDGTQCLFQTVASETGLIDETKVKVLNKLVGPESSTVVIQITKAFRNLDLPFPVESWYESDPAAYSVAQRRIFGRRIQFHLVRL